MSTTHLQVIIPAITAIPADSVVNTWHFSAVGDPRVAVGGDGVTAFGQWCVDKLVAFYNSALRPGGVSYWNSEYSPTTATMKLYDEADPHPRVPYFTAAANLGAVDAADAAAPSELALCLSYSALVASGDNPKRRRGRVFLGPLSTRALSAASGEHGRPPAALRTAIATSAGTLKSAGSANSYWTQWSTTDAQQHKVVSGWVDNAFDIQRRRGFSPTARTVFT